MKFPRQAKLFHGQLNVAPVAAVVLLLLMFLKLGTLIYTPGVLVQLDSSNTAPVIHVGVDGSFRLGTNTYAKSETNQLRMALQQSPGGPPFHLALDPSTPVSVAAQARATLDDLLAIRLPSGSPNLLGTDNPTVIVAVNLNGLYFYENRIVSESELKDELGRRVREAARESKVLTVTVVGDELVNFRALTRLTEVAREVGVKDVLLAEQPERPPPVVIVPSP